ncbi:MAG TPA: hypothetical protein VFT22_18295 [Kofleriaceae bacterium]|nr:hypothetical protein [Kofleriaceae bacterium]
MIESFVDVTVRGLSLGRRIRLGQVRPSSGYLEVAGPMPVGTHVVIATDDGVAIDATVTWVHEQVAGESRPPGMIVAPALAGDQAAAWWAARVTLPDEPPRSRTPRARPLTARPRAKTLSTPPPSGPATEDVPTIIADLDARVTAAAGLGPRADSDHSELRTAVMNAVEQAQLEAQSASPGGEPAMRSTGEHLVIDDGHQTMLMAAIDPGAAEGEPGDAGEAGPDDRDPAGDGARPGGAGRRSP